MSYSMYVWRFVDGEPAPMDETAIRDVLGPVTLGGMPAAGLPESWDLEAEDGGAAEVYGDVHGLTFSRFSPGHILDLVAELARRTGAVVIPLNCPAILTTEAHRKHLPENFWEEAIVVPPAALTGHAIAQVINPQPEPRRRPILPQFPYHPSPVATGSVTASDEPCVCCAQERGWVYAGPVYAADAPDTGICPYCIAFGTAAERYGASFTDTVDGDVPQDVVTAILERTPGFTAWQSPYWLTHCGDGATFLGRAGAKELQAYPDAVDHLRRECAAWEWPPDQVEGFLGSLEKDDQPTAYLFRCRVCAVHLAYADFT
ncbi:CbrC family protein [Streptomyces sp. NPDC048275]|uniref:CbrC family protein n=1 Tax=Streptomyces sp. NPDC048275 TaxID=3155629 RepID=UPI0033D1E765